MTKASRSMSETLTRILKEHGQVWKRTRHSVK